MEADTKEEVLWWLYKFNELLGLNADLVDDDEDDGAVAGFVTLQLALLDFIERFDNE